MISGRSSAMKSPLIGHAQDKTTIRLGSDKMSPRHIGHSGVPTYTVPIFRRGAGNSTQCRSLQLLEDAARDLETPVQICQLHDLCPPIAGSIHGEEKSRKVDERRPRVFFKVITPSTIYDNSGALENAILKMCPELGWSRPESVVDRVIVKWEIIRDRNENVSTC